ncbi:MAG: ribosomal protein S17E [Candidatus Woesearchaeota archaeon]|jgi:ribosomal protein S17E
MGRIRTKLTKRLTRKVMTAGEFGKSFEENKKTLGEVAIVHSKKIRNIIAGYAVKIVKSRRYD